MSFFDIVTLLGGLALFLYGMTILGNGLERLSGGRLERTLERMTSNIFKAVLLGVVVTAAVQSSSATTVIVVGLVNAGILKLRQAIGVIMGANIGTTVTAHIIRLTDIGGDNFAMQMLSPKTLAPLMAVAGIVMIMAGKRNKIKETGQILMGIGVLFTGLFNMEAAVSVLQDSPQVAQLFVALKNPLLGVLAGAVVTAIIQSSSASVGILQALSASGLINFSSAFPIIMGQNIGTCVTPLLSSIGASKNAKRAAMVHLYFNIIGTLVFLVGVYTLNYFFPLPFWESPVTKGSIANFHTLFNVVVTTLFLPFTGLLEKLANWTVRSSAEETKELDGLSVLDDRFMVSPSLAVEQARSVVLTMGKIARQNLWNTESLLKEYDPKLAERIKEEENTLDRMEDKLGAYLLKLTKEELSEPESRGVSELLHLITEYERIGDYATNIMENAENMYLDNVRFSPQAAQEMDAIFAPVHEIVDLAVECTETRNVQRCLDIEPLEEVVDFMEETLKARHIDRLRRGLCTVDAGFPFLEVLSCLERISDHCSNIGVFLIGYEAKMGMDRHEYIRELHKGGTEGYTQKYKIYEKKYFYPILEMERQEEQNDSPDGK